MTFALMLAFFRNNMGFGGNNGLTDFKDHSRFRSAGRRDKVRALLIASGLALCLGFLICKAVTAFKYGKVIAAVRDAESRTRFLGYRVDFYKLAGFTLSACMAGVGGAFYVPQVGIINPSEFTPAISIEIVVWVAVGGRGTLYGAIVGAILVNYAKTWLTGAFPEVWLFALGALFVVVTLFLPKGIVGTLNEWIDNRRAVGPRHRAKPNRRRRSRPMTVELTDSTLYLDGVSVSFDGFKALNDLSLILGGRDARHHWAKRRRQDHHDGCHYRQDSPGQGRDILRRHG